MPPKRKREDQGPDAPVEPSDAPAEPSDAPAEPSGTQPGRGRQGGQVRRTRTESRSPPSTRQSTRVIGLKQAEGSGMGLYRTNPTATSSLASQTSKGTPRTATTSRGKAPASGSASGSGSGSGSGSSRAASSSQRRLRPRRRDGAMSMPPPGSLAMAEQLALGEEGLRSAVDELIRVEESLRADVKSEQSAVARSRLPEPRDADTLAQRVFKPPPSGAAPSSPPKKQPRRRSPGEDEDPSTRASGRMK